MVRHDRIERAQRLMREQGLTALMIMNHDDYRYFFGRDWTQPRAVIPSEGPPVMIAYAAEAVRTYVGNGRVRVFTHVGEQIKEVVIQMRELSDAIKPPPGAGKTRVEMQLWFETPAFLVDLFRKVNPQVELVASDPVMDVLRVVKEPDELARIREAQRIAALGMDRVREMLRPGATAQEVATEALYVMMKAGAERTSSPLYVNFGPDTCMLHGRLSTRPLVAGDLAVVDLTPQVEGYCANLARTFVLGEPGEAQRSLLLAYEEMVEATRRLLKSGTKVQELDEEGKRICTRHGLGDHHIDGISHGIGLRFEEAPASTIHKQHRTLPLREGMTLTIGHTILAVPGVGGVRFEDVYRVTPEGGEALYPYSCDPVVKP